jgi:hypothetical protein
MLSHVSAQREPASHRARPARLWPSATKYFKVKYATPLEVLMPIAGNPARIVWLARYDSLAHSETLTSKLLADKEYMELVSQARRGSVHDNIWRTV